MNTEVINLKDFTQRIGTGEAAFLEYIRLHQIKKGVVFVNGYPKMLYEIAKAKKGVFTPGIKFIVMNLELELN